jgi:hypothetical protein
LWLLQLRLLLWLLLLTELKPPASCEPSRVEAGAAQQATGKSTPSGCEGREGRRRTRGEKQDRGLLEEEEEEEEERRRNQGKGG